MRAIALSLLALAVILCVVGCGKKEEDVAAAGARVGVQSPDGRSGVASGAQGGTASPGQGVASPEGAVSEEGAPIEGEQPGGPEGADTGAGAPGQGMDASPMGQGDPAEMAKQMAEGMKVEGDEKSGKVTVQGPSGPMSITYKNTEDAKITASNMGLPVPPNSKRMTGLRTAATIPAEMMAMSMGAAQGAKAPAKPATITAELAIYQCPGGVEDAKKLLKSKFGDELMDLSAMAASMPQGGQGLGAMLPGTEKLLEGFKPEGIFMLMKDGKMTQVLLGPGKQTGNTTAVLVRVVDMPQALSSMMGGGMKGAPGKAPAKAPSH